MNGNSKMKHTNLIETGIKLDALVYSYEKGWGHVVGIASDEVLPIEVAFDNFDGVEYFDQYGRRTYDDPAPSLFWDA